MEISLITIILKGTSLGNVPLFGFNRQTPTLDIFMIWEDQGSEKLR